MCESIEEKKFKKATELGKGGERREVARGGGGGGDKNKGERNWVRREI
jgi:hypothetical protein